MVSIVVPIYNTEKYLKRCVDSLINQTYKDLEIILVNDGSTDLSGEICNEYSKKDSRVKVIHKENGGEATARQAGIDIATSEYLMFCDSDDEYFLSAVETLVKNTSDINDLVVGAYVEITGDKKRYACIGESPFNRDEILLAMLQNFKSYSLNYIISTLNCKLFKTSILRENAITLNKNFVVGNDTLFVLDYLKYCNRIIDTFEPMYIYYKFDVSERVQGMAWLYPDFYRLTVTASSKIYDILEDAYPKEKFSEKFSVLIGDLIRSVPYEKYFENNFRSELEWAADNDFIRLCALNYTPKRPQDSRTFAKYLLDKDIESMYNEISSKCNKGKIPKQLVRKIYIEE